MESWRLIVDIYIFFIFIFNMERFNGRDLAPTNDNPRPIDPDILSIISIGNLLPLTGRRRSASFIYLCFH